MNRDLSGTQVDGIDAHDIIAGSKPTANSEQGLINAPQVEGNVAANGVLLPGGPGIPRSQGMSHRGAKLHSEEVLGKINKRLESVISRSGNSWGKNRALLKAEAEAIGREIDNNQFP